MQEIWLTINGCDGAYSVSNHGRVRSNMRSNIRKTSHQGFAIFTIKERILKNSIGSSHGYPVVNIKRYGIQAPQLVHRLIAEAFIGPCPDGFECAHNDGDRSNPMISNLRWSSHADNMKDKVNHKTQPYGELVNLSKLSAAQVAAIRVDTRNQTAIATSYGVHPSTISYILSRSTWGHI